LGKKEVVFGASPEEMEKEGYGVGVLREATPNPVGGGKGRMN